MMIDKGFCQKHNWEFFLTEGCPQCLAELPDLDFTAEEINSEQSAEIDQHVLEDTARKAKEQAAMIPQAGGDLEVINYYSQAMKLQEYAESRIIKTVDDIKIATDDLSIIARLKKAMEEKRKGYVKPLQGQVKNINDNYKLWMAPVEAADKITREKILAYKREQERIRGEQEEINRKRLEAAEAEMKLKGELTESVNLVEVIPEAPRRVSTDMGTTGTMKIRKYRVVDFAELPDQYKIENSALLNKVIKAGIPSIPGVEIYEEETIRVNAR